MYPDWSIKISLLSLGSKLCFVGYRGSFTLASSITVLKKSKAKGKREEARSISVWKERNSKSYSFR